MSEKRLIDANALWEGEFIEEEDEYQRGWNDALRGAQHAAPTIDAVEVVHGRWVDVIDFGGGNCYGHCSKCSTPHKAENAVALRAAYRYCRYCGAKMDGDAK